MEWKLRGYEVIEVGSGARIADMNRAWPQEDIMKHANRIVKAVNCHDDLVEALNLARKWLNNFVEHSPIIFGGEDKLSAVIEQALAKAEVL